MLEFRIIEKVKDSKEFSLHTFTDFNSCYNKLLEILKDKKNYYVYNNFFTNSYDSSIATYHYRIEFRKVDSYKVVDILDLL